MLPPKFLYTANLYLNFMDEYDAYIQWVIDKYKAEAPAKALVGIHRLYIKVGTDHEDKDVNLILNIITPKQFTENTNSPIIIISFRPINIPSDSDTSYKRYDCEQAEYRLEDPTIFKNTTKHIDRLLLKSAPDAKTITIHNSQIL